MLQTTKKTKWQKDMENVQRKYKINKTNLLSMKPGKEKKLQEFGTQNVQKRTI